MEDNVKAKAPRKRTPKADEIVEIKEQPTPWAKNPRITAQLEEKPPAWVKPELESSLPALSDLKLDAQQLPRTEAENKEWKLIITGDVS